MDRYTSCSQSPIDPEDIAVRPRTQYFPDCKVQQDKYEPLTDLSQISEFTAEYFDESKKYWRANKLQIGLHFEYRCGSSKVNAEKKKHQFCKAIPTQFKNPVDFRYEWSPCRQHKNTGYSSDSLVTGLSATASSALAPSADSHTAPIDTGNTDYLPG